MPTFDFSNIVRKIVSAALVTIRNPIAICAAVIALITPLISTFTTWFNSFQFDGISGSIGFVYDDDLTRLLLYSIAWDLYVEVFINIGNFIISTVNLLIRISITSFSVISIYGACRALRSIIKDFSS